MSFVKILYSVPSPEIESTLQLLSDDKHDNIDNQVVEKWNNCCNCNSNIIHSVVVKKYLVVEYKQGKSPKENPFEFLGLIPEIKCE